MAADTTSPYDATIVYNKFLPKIGYVKEMSSFFSTLSNVLPEFAKSVKYLGVGPARGDMETRILSALPDCRFYTAVEQDEKALPFLTKRIELDHPKLSVKVVNSKVEDWSGPDEPVDIIVAAHMLYYVNDRKDVLSKMIQWLRPGGLLVVLVTDEHFSVVKILSKWGQRLSDGPEYRQPNLLADLKDIGAKIVLEKLVPFDLDYRDKDDIMANFLLQRQATEDEQEKLFSYIAELVPTGIEVVNNWVTIVQRQ